MTTLSIGKVENVSEIIRFISLYILKQTVTCLGKSCSFGLMCVPFVNVYEFLSVLLYRLVLWLGFWILMYEFLIAPFFLLWFTLFKHDSLG